MLRRLATIDEDFVEDQAGGQAQSGRGAQMPRWNFVAMGQVGLTGWRRRAAQPTARLVARMTGRPESEILSLIGAGFLLITLIDFLRTVDDVLAAGQPRVQSQGVPKRQGKQPA